MAATVRSPHWPLVALLVLAPHVLAACGAGKDALLQLKQATVPTRIPKVVACWEKQFEAAGFQGRYLAEVSFTVDGDGAISHAAIDAMYDASDDQERPAGAGGDQLGTCIVEALNRTRLQGVRGLRVVGMRIAFRDASSEGRLQASKSGANMLIGPRADRCQGLYAYDPPRETTKLLAELDAAQREAADNGDEPDKRARALQRAYDIALELSQRLAIDAGVGGLPVASKKRLMTARKEHRSVVRKLGAQIGCEAPP